LSGPDRRVYEVPEPYEVSQSIEKASFLHQLRYQIVRALIVAWRNRFRKFLDAEIIVGAALIITALDGVAELTSDRGPNIPFKDMVRTRPDSVESIFKELFKYAIAKPLQRRSTRTCPPFLLEHDILRAGEIGLVGFEFLRDSSVSFLFCFCS
jgi:hypothetical protein